MTLATPRIGDAVKRLDRHRLHGLPVVDGANDPVGVVSASDLVRVRRAATRS